MGAKKNGGNVFFVVAGCLSKTVKNDVVRKLAHLLLIASS
jgi:hypothetical protein